MRFEMSEIECKKKADLMLTVEEPIFNVFCMIEEAGYSPTKILTELMRENKNYKFLKC